MKIIMKCVQYVNCYNYVHHPFLYEKQSLKIVHNDFAISCSLWYYEAVQLYTYKYNIYYNIEWVCIISYSMIGWRNEQINDKVAYALSFS